MVTVMELYQLLPRTNCKLCGEATCMAFAVALLSRKKSISECTPLLEANFKSRKKNSNPCFYLLPVQGRRA